MPPKFKSKIFQRLYKEALRQGFTEHFPEGRNSHIVLVCPKRGCGAQVQLSTTLSDGAPFKQHNIITKMRRHGLLWEGRGGKHTAPSFGAAIRKRREEACEPR